MIEHEHPLLSYNELIVELKKLLRQRATGVMFISTLDNHAIQFSLVKGHITGCRFRLKHGLDAIPHIMEMEAGRYSFNPAPPGPRDKNLPHTKTLINILGEDVPHEPTHTPIQGGIDISALPSIITNELARYLGPIAAILVEDHLDELGPIQDSSSLQKLMKRVAAEISEENKREEFIQGVMHQL